LEFTIVDIKVIHRDPGGLLKRYKKKYRQSTTDG